MNKKAKHFARRSASVMIAAALITSVIVPSAAIAGASVSVNAAEYTDSGSVLTDGDFRYYINDDGNAVIEKYTGSSSELVIPDTIGGLQLGGLGRGAFAGCTKITLPAVNDLVISSGTFLGCSELKTITFPDGLASVTVADDAFRDCTALEAFVNEGSAEGIKVSAGMLYDGAYHKLICVPAATDRKEFYVPSTVNSISGYAFRNNKNTELISFRSCTGLTAIDPVAFAGAASVRTILLPKSISFADNDIGFEIPTLESLEADSNSQLYSTVDGVLYTKDMSSLVYYPAGKSSAAFTLPASVSSVNAESLSSNPYLSEITVEGGSGVYSAANGVLFSDKDGRTLVLYPRGKKDKSFTVPADVTRIGSYAFMNNSVLTSVNISDAVTEVCSDAFRNCSALSSVSIGSGLYMMPTNPFTCCPKLSGFTVSQNNSYFYTQDGVLYYRSPLEAADQEGSGEMIYLSVYPAAKNNTSFTVPENVSVIGAEAFFGNPCLKSVNAGASTLYIGYGAFSYCDALETAGFGSKLTDLSEFAFGGCSSLNAVTLPSSLENIGDTVFDDCTKLSGISGSGAGFITENGILYSKNKEKLICYPAAKADTSFTLPDSVRTMSRGAVRDNTYLEFVDLGSGISDVYGDVFDGCTALKGIAVSHETENFIISDISAQADPVIYYSNNNAALSFAIMKGFRHSSYISSYFANASYIDKDETYTSKPVKITGVAIGAKDNYSFTFEYKAANDQSFTTIGGSSGSCVTAEFAPKKAGRYIIKVTAKNSGGDTDVKYFDILASEGIANRSTADKSKLFLGDKVTLTGAATGGTGGYLYEYMYKLSTKTSWSKIKAYSADTSAVFTPKAAGKYDLCVKAKDSAGNISTKKFTLEVSEVTLLKNNSVVSAENVKVGNSVKVTAKASGGKTPYRYSFYFKRSNNTKWNLKGTEFGTETSFKFTPTAAAVYDIRVDIKDASGQMVSKTLKVSASNGVFENISTISTDFITEENTSVKLNGIAVGGQGSYRYAYYFKRASNSKWNSIGTVFGTKSTATLTTTALTDYDVMISIKDETGTVLSKTFRITSSIPAELKNDASVNGEAFLKGDTIRIQGAASGGVSPYKYTYQFKRSVNSTWKTIGSADTTAKNASISNIAAAEYDIRVIVKDSAGKTVTKSFRAAGYDLVNSSTVSTSTIIIGSTVTISSKLTGGTGGCTYSYYYRIKGDENWTPIGQENVTSATATFKPEQAGSYELMTKITDGTGLVSEKTFDITVNEQLSNTSTINKTELKKGETVVLNGSAEGGIGAYSYAYYFKKASAQSWKPIGTEFDSRTKETYVPQVSGTYNFQVIVRDGTGKKSEMIFTVKVISNGDDELPIIPAR